MTHSFTKALFATGILAAASSALSADARDDEIKLLRDQVQLLDQKLRVLERKQEIKEEAATAAAPTTPKITINDKGFTFASADGANSLKLRGLIQADSRWFFNDGSIQTNDAFILRRARIIAEGTFNRIFEYQIVPEFGGGSTTLLDANLNIVIKPWAQVKVGKFKAPFGLELLQSDSWAFFAERSLVTNLVPNRDIGVQLGGDIFAGTVNYAVGVFNGVPDGTSNTTNADFDDEKDLVVRVFAHPFKNSAGSLFQGLGVGVAASVGNQETATGLNAGLRTDGQQVFYRYRTTAVADGQTWRVSPQAYYYQGPLGLLAEYVHSVVNARPTATGAKVELVNKSWQLAAGYVLTGEDSSFKGLSPKQNFDPAAGTWGAFEVVARYAKLDVDDDAFPLVADPAASAAGASSWGVGLNWYLSKTIRASFDYFRTDFDRSALAPATLTNAVIRQNENALITRVQLSF